MPAFTDRGTGRSKLRNRKDSTTKPEVKKKHKVDGSIESWVSSQQSTWQDGLSRALQRSTTAQRSQPDAGNGTTKPLPTSFFFLWIRTSSLTASVGKDRGGSWKIWRQYQMLHARRHLLALPKRNGEECEPEEELLSM